MLSGQSFSVDNKPLIDWLQYEGRVFWGLFTVTFLAVAWWESKRPNRKLSIPTGARWGVHAMLMLAAGLARMLILRSTPVAAALWAGEHGGGIASLGRAPLWLAVPLTLLALDFTKYVVHRTYHNVEWLWRVHRVHHSDPDFDVSTGARFHPVEAVVGQAADLGVILFLAPPAVAVFIALVVVTVMNNVQHANADFAPGWERALRPWLITPAIHRTHHSDRMADQLSNFGELVPWWDKLLGTYRARPEAGEQNLVVGLPGFRDARSSSLGALLLQPLLADRQPTGPDSIANARAGQVN